MNKGSFFPIYLFVLVPVLLLQSAIVSAAPEAANSDFNCTGKEECMQIAEVWGALGLGALVLMGPHYFMENKMKGEGNEIRMGAGTDSLGEMGFLANSPFVDSPWALTTMIDLQVFGKTRPARMAFGMGAGLPRRIDDDYSALTDFGLFAEGYEKAGQAFLGAYVQERLVRRISDKQSIYLNAKASKTDWLVWRATLGSRWRTGSNGFGDRALLELSYEENHALKTHFVAFDIGFSN